MPDAESRPESAQEPAADLEDPYSIDRTHVAKSLLRRRLGGNPKYPRKVSKAVNDYIRNNISIRSLQLALSAYILVGPVRDVHQYVPKLRIIHRTVSRPDTHNPSVLRHADVPGQAIPHIGDFICRKPFLRADVRKKVRIRLSFSPRQQPQDSSRWLEGPH